MLEKDFYQLCESALLGLAEAIELKDTNSQFDVEYSDGILKIVIVATNKTYIINRNSCNQKIWSCAFLLVVDYFSFDEKNNPHSKMARNTRFFDCRNCN